MGAAAAGGAGCWGSRGTARSLAAALAAGASAAGGAAFTAVSSGDGANSHTATIPGTMDHFQFPVRIPCAATASTSGGTCQVATTFNTVLPGAVVEGKRAIWELPEVQVRDGGVDGSANSDDYATFLVQGLFAP